MTALTEEIKGEHKREKEQIKASFYRSLEQIKEEFANEITLATESLQVKHKKEMGKFSFTLLSLLLLFLFS
jgi:F0F1-type ATP synthase membrane subunit b/b'